MKSFNLSYLAGLLALFPLLLSQAANAWEPICELPMGGSCASHREAIKYPGDYGPQEYCAPQPHYYCLLKSAAVPPTPAWIHCQSTSAYTTTCSAWPRGDMQYDWASSWGITVPEDSSGHTITASCLNPGGNGTVSVEITTSQGLKETVFAGVQCGTIEY